MTVTHPELHPSLLPRFEGHSSTTTASTEPSCSHGSNWPQSNERTRQHVKAVIHDIPHIRQLFNWDCGLACVLMVLQGLGFRHFDYNVLRQLCPTTSIWTVDLAHLIRRFGLDVTFFTITVGLNPAYRNEDFYVQHLREDEVRVQQLFHQAAQVGITVQQRSLSSLELQELMLSARYLAIALVDKRRLSAWLAAADFCLPSFCGMDIGYTGHYIVICGYDPEHNEFMIRDPASSVAEQRISADVLDQARQSFGTDEDLLVIATQLAPNQQAQ